MASRKPNGALVRGVVAELRRHPELRDSLLAALEDGVATKADIAKILERLDRHDQVLAHHAEVLERHSRAIERLIAAVEEQGRRIEEQGRRIEAAFLHVDALGARWGLKSEASFREALRSVLSRRFGATVERWRHHDADGRVFGRPADVEVDVVVRNGGTLLIEVKSHASRGDVAAFDRIAALYEQVTGRRADRLIESPSVDEAARVFAEQIAIEISTDLG